MRNWSNISTCELTPNCSYFGHIIEMMPVKVVALSVWFCSFLLMVLSALWQAYYLHRKREVMFLPLFVCLSVCPFVCPLDYSKSYERILIKKFFGGVGRGPRNRRWHFGGNLDQCSGPGNFLKDLLFTIATPLDTRTRSSATAYKLGVSNAVNVKMLGVGLKFFRSVSRSLIDAAVL